MKPAKIASLLKQWVPAAAAVIGSLLASAPGAAARPDTRAMRCEAAAGFVRSHGAVVMSTGVHTYDRIVSGLGHCGAGEETALKVAPTLDNARCRIGYICRDRINDPILRFHLKN